MKGDNTSIKKLIYLSVICLVTLSVTEGMVRMSAKLQTYSERAAGKYESYYGLHLPSKYLSYPPDSTVHYNSSDFTYEYKINSSGFRGSDSFDNTDSGSLKTLFLGDSFTEGIGAADSESWPLQLQKVYRANGHSSSIINGGMHGSDPFYEYVFLRDKLIQKKPQIVIQTINYSDLLEYIWRGGIQRFKSDGTVMYNEGPWFEPLYHYSHLFRLILHGVLKYDFTLLSPADFKKQIHEAVYANAGIIDSTYQLCRQNNIKYCLVIHPYPLSFHTLIPGHNEIREIERHIPKEIPLVDLFPDFSKKLNTQNYLEYSWPVDGHFNGKGYELFASLFYARYTKLESDRRNK